MNGREVSLRRMGVCEGGPHTRRRTGVGMMGRRHGWDSGIANTVFV